ncbi:MAG: hypothetical protein Q8896_14435, partial [Bacteroidota bacterium]|nr:hypothetical protein [Bacteroidota bacterium]
HESSELFSTNRSLLRSKGVAFTTSSLRDRHQPVEAIFNIETSRSPKDCRVVRYRGLLAMTDSSR